VSGGSAVPVVRIGGIPIAAVTYEGFLRIALTAPAAGQRLRVHFCSAHTIVESQGDETLRVALKHGALNVPDGVPLVWLGRSRGFEIERVCGLDALPDVADRGREFGARHFFYGGGQGVADTLAARLAEAYPGLVVAGTETPPFRPLTPEEDAAMVERLNAARPDYVWVGLGSPKQDLWLAEHRAKLDAAALMAVGAAFDIVGGFRPRAPRALQRAGLEWLFRLAHEPRRLARRYTVVNGRFLALAATDFVTRRRLRGATTEPDEMEPAAGQPADRRRT
jgi:N-acetylglucosaminyldiphosphoundecaprenol N-acetyl-beta-D-mannosaminyltransferase